MHVPERLRELARNLRNGELRPERAAEELERIAVWLEKDGIIYVPMKGSSSCTT